MQFSLHINYLFEFEGVWKGWEGNNAFNMSTCVDNSSGTIERKAAVKPNAHKGAGWFQLTKHLF